MSGIIVCGTDLGPSGEDAENLAAAMSEATGFDLRLVHAGPGAVDDIDSLPSEIQPAAVAMVEELRRRTDAALAKLAAEKKRFTNLNNVTTVEAVGHPWEVLIEEADRCDANYVVVGPHAGRTAMLGTTPARVLRHCRRPVAVATSSPEAAAFTGPIIVGVDFGPSSMAAIRHGAELARRSGAQLLLIHALSLHSPVVEGSASHRRLVVEWGESVEASLHRLAEVHAPGVEVLADAQAGDPPELLHRIAIDRGARWIIVGTHGRAGMRRFLLGSVAERCVLGSPVPVLVVPHSDDG